MEGHTVVANLSDLYPFRWIPVPARLVGVGKQVLLRDVSAGDPHRGTLLVVKRESSEYEGTVYNLNVADVHNYVCRGGLVDNCHPRDQIALSWLAERLDLSRDVFGDMIKARERQTEWLADLAENESREGKLAILVLGKAYKKGTNLTLGSPAILLKNILDERPHLQVYQWDPHVDGGEWPLFGDVPMVFVVAADHDEFFSMTFPADSVVIDPWGKMKDQDGVKVIRVGRK